MSFYIIFFLKNIRGSKEANPADSDIKIKLSVSLIDLRFFLFNVEKIYRGKLKTFDNLCSTLLKNFGISLNSTIETLWFLSLRYLYP